MILAHTTTSTPGASTRSAWSLVFDELVDLDGPGFAPAYTIDQSHNVTDPLESLIRSADEIRRASAQALLVDRAALLTGHQQANDALMASETLKAGFRADAGPIPARARADAGGAIDPIGAYRDSRYRAKVAAERPAAQRGGGGIT